MDTPLLQQVYDPDRFRQQGHELVDLLADHLKVSLNGSAKKVIQYHTPEEEKEFWQDFLTDTTRGDFFPQVLNRTTHVHHPRYLGHQVCAPAPQAALCGLVSSLLNNGMAVYEMGMAPSAMERLVTDLLSRKIGFDEKARGILTSGGTLANLTALLSARKAMLKEDVWLDGHGERLAVMVSEEAHYCIDRAARIMGLGTEGIIKVPVTPDFSIDTSLLHSYYEEAVKKGLRVFALVGSAPSTATGVYDDLETLADFCAEKRLWFHIDAAHGGAAVFSKKYKSLVNGIRHADSVVIDGHKMMLMSTITTALLFRDGSHSHTTFSQEAEYLLQHSDEEDWFNLAKRTFECTKTMMSLQWFLLWKTYGESLFEENVTTLYDLGKVLAGLIEADPELELATLPHSNIVCFRYTHPDLSSTQLDDINREIRKELLDEGVFYIVQTRIKGVHYLRCTVMNPFTSKREFEALLTLVKGKGRKQVIA